jgi:hypothetical protein
MHFESLVYITAFEGCEGGREDGEKDRTMVKDERES